MLFSTAIAILAAAASANANAVRSVSKIRARCDNLTFPCDTIVPGGGLYSEFTYKVNCGKKVVNQKPDTTSTEKCEADCLAYCNGVKYCQVVNFQTSTNACLQYYHPAAEYVEDADWTAFEARYN